MTSHSSAIPQRARTVLICCVMAATLLIPVIPVRGYEESRIPKVEQSSQEQGSLLKRGFAKLTSYQLDEAIRCFTPLTVHYSRDLSNPKSRKNCAQMLTLIGRAFQFDENDVAAQQAYGLAYKLAPNDKTIGAYLANMLSRTGRVKEAEELFKSLAGDAGTNAAVGLSLAAHLSRSSDETGAQDALRKAMSFAANQPSASNVNWALGVSLVKERESKAVSQYFRKASDSVTSPYLKKLYMARACLCEENASQADKLYNEAGEILPGDPSWLVALSNTNYKCEVAAQALQRRIAAVQCRRFSSNAVSTLAEHQRSFQKFDEARKCVDFWKKLRPKAYEPYIFSARLHNINKNFAGAEQDLHTALALNPRSSSGWIELADLISKTKSPQDSIETIKKGTEQCPKSPRLWRYLGKVLLSCNRYEEAESAYKKALSLMPSKVDGLNVIAKKELGDIYAGIGACDYHAKRMPEAIKAAKMFNKCKFVIHLQGPLSLVHVRPDRLDFDNAKSASEIEHEALADMLYETKQMKDAIKEYRLAIVENPDSVDLHSFLFFVLRETDDWAGTMAEDFELANKIITKCPSGAGDLLKKWFSGK